MINAERVAIEVRTRQEGGAWRVRTFDPEDHVFLSSIDVRLPIAGFYEDVAV